MFRTALTVAVLVPLALFAAATSSAVTITSFTGTIGRASDLPYCYGSTLLISGSGFVTDGGTPSVTIGGVPAARVIVGSDSTIYALVGPGATTGNVVITTPMGTATSAVPETITPCQSSAPAAKAVVSTAPKKVRGGKKIELLGSGFIGTTSVTIDGASVAYAIPSDHNLYVVVPTTAKNGSVTIAITNAVGTTTTTVTKVA